MKENKGKINLLSAILISIILGFLWKIPPTSRYYNIILILLIISVVVIFIWIMALITNTSGFTKWFIAHIIPKSVPIPFPRFQSNGTEESHWSKIKECYYNAYFWLRHNRKKALIMKPPLPIFPNHKMHIENIQFNEWQRFMIGDGPQWDGGVLSRTSYGFITWYLNPNDVHNYLISDGTIDLEKGPIQQMDNFLNKIIKKTADSRSSFFFDRIVIVNLEKLLDNVQYKKYVKEIIDQYFPKNDHYRIRFIAEDHIESTHEAIELFKDMSIFSYDSESAQKVSAYSPMENNAIPLDNIEYDVIQTSQVLDDFLYLYYSLQKGFIKKLVENARGIIHYLNQNGHLRCDKIIREKINEEN